MRNWTGQQIGNYIIRRPIGDGGSASVYLGQHINLQNMQAAIKILHTSLSEKEIEAFRREADTVASLRHPNIVTLLDFDLRQNPFNPYEQIPFLVMPYYPHGTLRNRHPTGSQVPLGLVLHYVEQAARALQYAHDQRMIHRDVKPENMLVGENQEIVLSDFGIASIAHSIESVKTELPIGTFAYMAPEQFEGRPQIASDQYALAVIAYEWLTGTRPFTGGYESLIYQHFHTTPPSLLEKVPTLPGEVEHVIFTALSKDPNARFGSMRAFANAITAATHPGISQAPTVLSERMEVLAFHQQQTPTIRGYAAGDADPAKTPVLPETQSPRPRRWRAIQIISLIALVLLLFSTLGVLGVNYFQGRSLAANATATALADSLQQKNATTVAQAVQATSGAQQNATATAQANINAQATAEVASNYPYPSYLPGKGELKSVYVSTADFQDWNYSVDYAKSTIGGCGVLNDALYVKTTIAGTAALCKYPGDIDDFVLEVDMTIIKGDIGEIYFRAPSDQSSYVLLIAPDGRYRVVLIPDSNRANWAILGDGTHSAIKKGLNQTNRIAIYAKGANLRVYVNSQSIFQAENKRLNQGTIYFGAESAQSQETEISLAQIKVWQL